MESNPLNTIKEPYRNRWTTWIIKAKCNLLRLIVIYLMSKHYAGHMASLSLPSAFNSEDVNSLRAQRKMRTVLSLTLPYISIQMFHYIVNVLCNTLLQTLCQYVAALHTQWKTDVAIYIKITTAICGPQCSRYRNNYPSGSAMTKHSVEEE